MARSAGRSSSVARRISMSLRPGFAERWATRAPCELARILPEESRYNPRAGIPKEASMRLVRLMAILAAASSIVLSAQTSPLTAEQRAQFHGAYSQPEEPFRLVGNIYYVGAKNIASYLI